MQTHSEFLIMDQPPSYSSLSPNPPSYSSLFPGTLTCARLKTWWNKVKCKKSAPENKVTKLMINQNNNLTTISKINWEKSTFLPKPTIKTLEQWLSRQHPDRLPSPFFTCIPHDVGKRNFYTYFINFCFQLSYFFASKHNLLFVQVPWLQKTSPSSIFCTHIEFLLLLVGEPIAIKIHLLSLSLILFFLISM